MIKKEKLPERFSTKKKRLSRTSNVKVPELHELAPENRMQRVLMDLQIPNISKV